MRVKKENWKKRLVRFALEVIPLLVIGIATCGFVTNACDTLAEVDKAETTAVSEIENDNTASLSESIDIFEAANKAAKEAAAAMEAEEVEVEEIEAEEVEIEETETEEIAEVDGEEISSDETVEVNEPETVEPAYTVNTTSMTVWATNSLNVRSGPSTDYEVIGYCYSSEELEVTGVCAETGWYQITYENGTGFVSNEYVSETYIRTYNGIAEGDVIYGSASYYCSCSICCGKSDGITASGIKVYDGIVACNWLPLGTRILIDGTEYLVADRGSSNFDVVGRIDIYTSQGHQAAIEMGRNDITITIVSFPE